MNKRQRKKLEDRLLIPMEKAMGLKKNTLKSYEAEITSVVQDSTIIELPKENVDKFIRNISNQTAYLDIIKHVKNIKLPPCPPRSTKGKPVNQRINELAFRLARKKP